MNDMRAVIIPKSDQINADDLLGGPMTIIVKEVSIRPGTEQPVSIHFDGDNNKPYKPCKSMARVMVHCWGADANQYVGRSMTLYCDPKVQWGGMAVGGIRISHMTDIKGTQVMALTATKGSRKPFTVNPLVQAPAKTAITVASWIADKLATALIQCESVAALVKIQQGKAYISATERGTDDDRAEMKRLVDEALARIEPPATSGTDSPIADDDIFPGDTPLTTTPAEAA